MTWEGGWSGGQWRSFREVIVSGYEEKTSYKGMKFSKNKLQFFKKNSQNDVF